MEIGSSKILLPIFQTNVKSYIKDSESCLASKAVKP